LLFLVFSQTCWTVWQLEWSWSLGLHWSRSHWSSSLSYWLLEGWGWVIWVAVRSTVVRHLRWFILTICRLRMVGLNWHSWIRVLILIDLNRINIQDLALLGLLRLLRLLLLNLLLLLLSNLLLLSKLLLLSNLLLLCNLFLFSFFLLFLLSLKILLLLS
jgi:hypothetical protein